MRSSKGTAVYGYPGAKGFSLVEVMVALIVMSVGLLGIAKMQALALSSTTSARARSIAALEASSLASTMSADRAYWANVTADPAVTFSAGAVTAGDPALQLNATCPCTPPQIAFDDLSAWATDLNLQLPNVQGSVSCSTPAAVTPPTPPPLPTPVSCTISLNWTEQQVVSNAQQTTAAAAINYTLHVNP
jgi:type IV pilus assembly protein PilV